MFYYYAYTTSSKNVSVLPSNSWTWNHQKSGEKEADMLSKCVSKAKLNEALSLVLISLWAKAKIEA